MFLKIISLAIHLLSSYKTNIIVLTSGTEGLFSLVFLVLKIKAFFFLFQDEQDSYNLEELSQKQVERGENIIGSNFFISTYFLSRYLLFIIPSLINKVLSFIQMRLVKHADGVMKFADGLKKDAEGVTQVSHADGVLINADVL